MNGVTLTWFPGILEVQTAVAYLKKHLIRKKLNYVYVAKITSLCKVNHII